MKKTNKQANNDNDDDDYDDVGLNFKTQRL